MMSTLSNLIALIGILFLMVITVFHGVHMTHWGSHHRAA